MAGYALKLMKMARNGWICVEKDGNGWKWTKVDVTSENIKSIYFSFSNSVMN